MQSLDEKISAAIELIKTKAGSGKPVVLSSFGKDSIVLLDLVKKAEKKFPIIFFKEPFFPKKYEFANKVILENEYTVYDYPPLYTAIARNNAEMEIINYYQVDGKSIYLPTGITPPVGPEEFLCGLKDIYEKPTGSFLFPWDKVLVGHKNSDIDPIMGPIPLKKDFHTDERQTYIYPIRHFTDEDIWKYTVENKLPVSWKRYNKDNGYKEFTDKTYNPDYFPTCVECMKKENPERVPCPKRNGKLVKNVSAELILAQDDFSHYLGA